MAAAIDSETIRVAAARIASHVHHTPVLTCQAINAISKADIFFKCENFQKAGAFKSRGAINSIFSLTEEEARHGVCTHSSGNHAGALARAAFLRGIPAFIVMPSTAARIKVAAVESYGGNITFCAPTLADRERTLDMVKQERGATEIHPYNDFRTIAGQSTAAWEFHHETPGLEMIIAPVGGGGLLSGTAISTHYLQPACQVIGAEPAGADDAYRSLNAGVIIPSVKPKTIADGLLTSLGNITFPIIQQYVDQILRVDEEHIIRAMRLIWERMKIIVEPSAAVPLAAVIQHPSIFYRKRIGIILSGGNLDLDHLPWQS